MQTAIKYFSVFGGYDVKIDTTKPLEELIKSHILNNYEELKREVHYLTGGYHIDHAILSGVALGDRRTNSSFKRAHVSFEEGMSSVENLCDRGIIEIESSFNFLAKKANNSDIAKKLLFTTPFLRFWFAFVSPIYKGIRDRKYTEFEERFQNNFTQFQEFIFEELCMEYTRDFYEKEGIKDLGKYWDKSREIDVVLQTKDNKIVVGVCKNTTAKIKKAVLTKLMQDCKDIGLNADVFILFANNGFSNELKAMKSEELRLFNAKSLKLLTQK
ncbi:DUF234 domain-containing protein [Arcobacter sp. YIC-464]|uniref:DUF234 domain-containing protein n=1 Tax=Arcobacter sp. YIC-464 TaxID=3376631 RepID=UPI003C1DE76D